MNTALGRRGVNADAGGHHGWCGRSIGSMMID
jgi:hypothetical protein